MSSGAILSDFEGDVALLTSLGLSQAQAKVYLLLVSLGKLTVNEVSKALRLNRGDVFRALCRLQTLDLVDKIITSPAEYESVSFQQGVSMLLEQREKKSTELKQRASELIDTYRKRNMHLPSDDEQKAQFVLLPEGLVRIKIREAVRNMQSSLDLVNTWKMRQMAFYNQTEEREKSLMRGVKFRIITDKPPVGQSITGAKRIKECSNHELRYCLTPVIAPLRIFDRKEVFIMTSPSTTSQEAAALWSNSPSLVSVAQGYFDMLWLASNPCKKNKTNAL